MNEMRRCPHCRALYPATCEHFYRNGSNTLRARCMTGRQGSKTLSCAKRPCLAVTCELQRKWEANQRRRRLKMERIAQRVQEALQ